MQNNRRVWTGIWLFSLLLFFGGYFFGVHGSEYFDYFVAFCMVFAAAVYIYGWKFGWYGRGRS